MYLHCLLVLYKKSNAVKIFQIHTLFISPNPLWWQNKCIYIMNGLRASNFSANIHFGVNYSFNHALFVLYALTWYTYTYHTPPSDIYVSFSPPKVIFGQILILTPVKCHLRSMSSYIPLPYDRLVTEDLCSAADISNSYIDIHMCRMTWKGQSKISLSSHDLGFWFCWSFTRSLAHARLSLHRDIRADSISY